MIRIYCSLFYLSLSSIVWAENPFASRLPPPPPIPPPPLVPLVPEPEAPPPPTQTLPSWQLLGIIQAEQVCHAWIWKETRRRWLSLGESWAGWMLSDCREGEVWLRSGNQTKRLRLDQASQTVSPSKALAQ